MSLRVLAQVVTPNAAHPLTGESREQPAPDPCDGTREPRKHAWPSERATSVAARGGPRFVALLWRIGSQMPYPLRSGDLRCPRRLPLRNDPRRLPRAPRRLLGPARLRRCVLVLRWAP